MATTSEKTGVHAEGLAGVEALRPGRLAFLKELWLTAKRKPLGTVAAVIILAMVIAALFAERVATYDPYEANTSERFKPPSMEHFLGTDQMGRDMFSRIIYGARISLIVGLFAAVGSRTIATIFGVIAGYLGGTTDNIIMRVMDAMMAFPSLVLAMALVVMMGASLRNVIIAIVITGIAAGTRVMRSAVISVKSEQYIEAARSIGCSERQIMWSHVLPNVTAPLIVLTSLSFAGAILAEAGLSFLGLGPPPPTPSWGGMLSVEGRSFFKMAPWLAIWPGVAISLAVYAFNIFGDALRDILDPRLKGEGIRHGA